MEPPQPVPLAQPPARRGVAVRSLVAHRVPIALRKPFRHASFTRSATDNLIVRCVLDDGTEGFGEGVPRDYVTGETIDSAIALLKESDLTGQLAPCRDFAQAVSLVERLRLRPVPGDERGCQGNAARCALELALLDAYGKRYGEALATVTRLLAPDLYQPQPWIRYSGAITSARAGLQLRLAAWRLWVYRFTKAKVKVGIDGYDDVHRLKVIRRQAGSGMDLRIDANEAWSPGQATQRIRELLPFGISAVEQPVPHAEVGALADVRRQTQVPIMLDESLCSAHDAERAIEQHTCDLF